MRPKKIREVKCSPLERTFRPQVQTTFTTITILTLDEFEAIRLLDFERLSQTAVAKQMKVHRSTVSRIASSARQKIAGALVENNTIKIEGGCCKVI